MIATIGSITPKQLWTDTQRPDVRTLAGDLVKLVIQAKILESRIVDLKNRIGSAAEKEISVSGAVVKWKRAHTWHGFTKEKMRQIILERKLVPEDQIDALFEDATATRLISANLQVRLGKTQRQEIRLALEKFGIGADEVAEASDITSEAQNSLE